MEQNFENLDEIVRKTRRARTVETFTFLLMFAIFAIIYRGVVYNVEYRMVPVVSVTQVPGKTLSSRLVVVDLGDRHFAIRTSDLLLSVAQGGVACVSKRTLIGGRWRQYRLALPGYCGSIRPSGFFGGMFNF